MVTTSLCLRILQVAQLWLTDRVTAYVRKLHCAVVGTAIGYVQGWPTARDTLAICQARKTRTDWPGRHNNLNRYAPGCPAKNISVCRGVCVLRRRWVTFGEHLSGKGTSPTNQCWCQKTRVIAISCGIRQTDGQMDRIAIAIPCVALHAVAW